MEDIGLGAALVPNPRDSRSAHVPGGNEQEQKESHLVNIPSTIMVVKETRHRIEVSTQNNVVVK